MIRGSAQMEEALTGSHEVYVRCEAYISGRYQGELDLASDASVRVDGGQFVRRTLSTSFVTDDRDGLVDLLSAPGLELAVFRGVRTPDGWSDDLPVFTGSVVTMEADWPDSPVKVTCADRGRRITRARFTSPRASRPGYSVPQQVRSLVSEVAPLASFVDETRSGQTVAATTWERDRDAAVTDLAKSIGAETFAAPDGSWVLRPVRPPMSAASMTVSESDALISASISSSMDDVYNTVVATSESSDGAAFWGMVEDRTSPTRVQVIGPSVRFYASPLLQSNGQCEVAARSILRRVMGARRSVSFSTLAHPGLEAGDRVDVEVRGEVFPLIIDSFTLPVWGSTITDVTSRAVTVEGE